MELKRQMGQIRKRGKFYQIRYYRNGQRIEETTEYTSYDEARTLLKDREGEISKGVAITTRSIRLTFDDAVQDVIDDYTVNGKPSKPELERRIRLHVKPYFTGRRMSAIQVPDIRAYAAA